MIKTVWTITGADGEPILGNVHLPAGPARGVVVVAHGFKGYKDYGMFPRLASSFAAAGFLAYRFNFSHSGMTDDISTFAWPDLFERDTWNRQVHDLRAVIDAIAAGRLEGAGLPLVLFGHSRGGVTTLLTAGRFARDETFPAPAGIVSASAPSRCNTLTPEQAEEMRANGFLVSPSSRTGQDLRVGRAFLDEQIADPAAHDLLALVADVRCPVLIAHGTDDPTVPVACAHELKTAIDAGGAGGAGRARLHEVAGANHVFNTPNPMPDNAEPSPALATLIGLLTAFAGEVCDRDDGS